MTLHVLVGPSLAADKIKAIAPNAVIHPPAKHGSIYKLIEPSCNQILLIDGLFYYDASVWHREILAALNSGIEVFGCASMGALRAIELSLYGMIGMGRVFDYYCVGVTDGDDEVAVLHGPESQGYQALTIPLITLRWNFDLLKNKGKLSETDLKAILLGVKKMPFHDRSWNKVFNSDSYQGYFTNNQMLELEGLALEYWQDPKELDAIDALIKITNSECKVISTIPKLDRPQPNYVSNAINTYIVSGCLTSSRDICNDLTNEAILELICIFNYIAPLVLSSLTKSKATMTSKKNFLERNAEAIVVDLSCIVSSVLSMFDSSNNDMVQTSQYTETRQIVDLTICLGYLSIISGFSTEQQIIDPLQLPMSKQDLYNIGVDMIKSGAKSLGLESSREDPVFAIAAQKLLSNS